MGVTVTNLTQGPGTLYYGTFGAAEPADTDVNLTPQASAWTDAGGTQGGLELSVNQTYAELDVDQVVDVPGRRITKREMGMKTNLAEPTLYNLALALNSGTPATGTGFVGLDPTNDTSAVNPTYSAFIFDGFAGTKRRRVILRRGLSTEAVASSYSKTGQAVLPVNFQAHYVSNSIRPFRIVDSTT